MERLLALATLSEPVTRTVCEWFKARITHQHLVGDDVFEYEVHFDGWSTMWDESKCWKQCFRFPGIFPGF